MQLARRSASALAGASSRHNVSIAPASMAAASASMLLHSLAAPRAAAAAAVPAAAPSRLARMRPIATASAVPHGARSFASITLTPSTSAEFEHEMSSLLESLSLLLDSSRFEAAGLDVSLADGVLSVAHPDAGTWVLNKHGPTRQMWLSSPQSGPRKFNLHMDVARGEAGESAASVARAEGRAVPLGEGWLGERDQADSLKARLIDEWSRAFGVDIHPIDDFQPEHH